MKIRGNKGQALVEIAFSLPILLIVLVCAYATTRTAILKSRAESAAFTSTLRAGRNLGGIASALTGSVSHERQTVTIHSERTGNSRLLPPPFPAMTGKTSSAVEIRKPWKELGEPSWLPRVRITHKEEFHVDCWGKDSSSGKSTRRYISGLVVLGAIR